MEELYYILKAKKEKIEREMQNLSKNTDKKCNSVGFKYTDKENKVRYDISEEAYKNMLQIASLVREFKELCLNRNTNSVKGLKESFDKWLWSEDDNFKLALFVKSIVMLDTPCGLFELLQMPPARTFDGLLHELCDWIELNPLTHYRNLDNYRDTLK